MFLLHVPLLPASFRHSVTFLISNANLKSLQILVLDSLFTETTFGDATSMTIHQPSLQQSHRLKTCPKVSFRETNRKCEKGGFNQNGEKLQFSTREVTACLCPAKSQSQCRSLDESQRQTLLGATFSEMG